MSTNGRPTNYQGVPHDARWIHSRCHYSTPLWIAVSPSRRRLYVVCAGCGRTVADVAGGEGPLGLEATATPEAPK